VSEADSERSSGYRRLDEAAREAALECKYSRRRSGRQADESGADQVYRWRLTDNNRERQKKARSYLISL